MLLKKIVMRIKKTCDILSQRHCSYFCIILHVYSPITDNKIPNHIQTDISDLRKITRELKTHNIESKQKNETFLFILDR